MSDRESLPDRAAVETDKAARARLEAANGLRQADFMFETIEHHLASGARFRFRPSLLGELNRLAVEGLTPYAGVPRPHGMQIVGSGHVPPPANEVQKHLEDMCDYVMEHWDRSPVHLASYVMWKLNWIHPYDDGNGRTSRAAAYIVLSLRLSIRLPGVNTIVDQIVSAKPAYYRALEAADKRFAEGSVGVDEMEALISSLLARQFAMIHEHANSPLRSS